MVYYHMERLGQDLEAFAQHANRSTIKVDDVKLYARHNEEMCQFLQQIMDEQKAKDDKDARPRGRKRKIEAPSLDP
ncbi:hypothetical protein BDF19DRAFT_438907 [Syncephalis fuscata]|nr:hypothetical protein BDF19DRAFT_438907 [Syncephalis fuscata]